MKLKPKNIAEWYINATQKERGQFLKK